MNKNAALVSHGVFYPKKRQVHWWVALNSANTPDTRIVVYIKAFTPSVQGVRRGWSIYTGARQSTLASVMYAANVDVAAARSLALQPLTATSGSMLISQEDTGNTDNSTLYRAYWRTKPYVLGQLAQYGGIRAATLMAEAASGVSVNVGLVRDFGVESINYAVDLTPVGSETTVIKPIDNEIMSHNLVVQVEGGDQSAQDADWTLDMLTLIPRTEENL